MRIKYLVYPPQTGEALDFDEEFDKISEKWAEKARQLQKRRWLKIRQLELRQAGSFNFRRQKFI